MNCEKHNTEPDEYCTACLLEEGDARSAELATLRAALAEAQAEAREAHDKMLGYEANWQGDHDALKVMAVERERARGDLYGAQAELKRADAALLDDRKHSWSLATKDAWRADHALAIASARERAK